MGRPPISLVNELRLLNDKCAWPNDEARMYDTPLFPERASGMSIWMEGDPKPYLDLVMGYSSVNFGHCHPRIMAAIREAMRGVDQVHSFHTRPQLELSRLLVAQLDEPDGYRVYLDVGGTSAVAAALRLCQAYTKRKQIVAFQGSFHGVAHICAAASDPRLLNSAQYGEGLLYRENVVHLPFADAMKGPPACDALGLLEATLSQNTTAAIIIEPVQGAAGFIIPDPSFIPGVQLLAEQYGVPLIFDEIQSGLGRCGRFFAYRRWTTRNPDLLVLSKSLAGGYYPLSALIARNYLLDDLPTVGTAFQSTFNNNPFGATIALRTMEFALEEHLFTCADAKYQMLYPLLLDACASPYIKNMRGVLAII